MYYLGSETGSCDVSSTGVFDFNQSASVMSSVIDSHDSADFLLWDKFQKIDMSAQSSPVIPFTAQQSPLRTSSMMSQQNTQTPLVLTPATTPILTSIVVNDENKENIELSNLQKKDLIKKEPETEPEPETHNSFVIGSSIIATNSSVCMVDKGVQVSIGDEINKDKGSDSIQPPITSTAPTTTTSNSSDSDLSEIRHPFSNILNNPVFIMEYLMDYAEFKMREEERFNIVMNEISRLSDRVSKLDDRIKDFIDEF